MSILIPLAGKRYQQRHLCHDLGNVQQESTKICYFKGLRSTLHIAGDFTL